MTCVPALIVITLQSHEQSIRDGYCGRGKCVKCLFKEKGADRARGLAAVDIAPPEHEMRLSPLCENPTSVRSMQGIAGPGCPVGHERGESSVGLV